MHLVNILMLRACRGHVFFLLPVELSMMRTNIIETAPISEKEHLDQSSHSSDINLNTVIRVKNLVPSYFHANKDRSLNIFWEKTFQPFEDQLQLR